MSEILAQFEDDDGMWSITAKEFEKHIGSVDFDSVFKVVKSYGGGLVEIKLSNVLDDDNKGVTVVWSDGGTTVISAGNYLVLCQGENHHNWPFLALDESSVIVGGDAFTVPVTLSRNGENELTAFTIERESGETMTAGLVMANQLATGAAFMAYKEKKELLESLPNVTVKELESTDYPLDKPNSLIWNIAQTGRHKHTIDMRSEADKRHGRKPINTAYIVDLSKLENTSIAAKLTEYDQRVYIACDAIFNSGADVFSVQQIYQAMGYKGRAGTSDISKINDALTKMKAAEIVLDNREEATAYNYPHFRYDSVLLPMERVQAIVNGQVVESVVHLFREPPLMTFARERKHITTISTSLLASPLSKTDANLRLENYLLKRISQIKKANGKLSNKMLFATIYEKTGIKTRKQRERVRDKLQKLMKHYKEQGFIKSYDFMADGVRIFY